MVCAWMVFQMRAEKESLSEKEFRDLEFETRERLHLTQDKKVGMNTVTYGISEEIYILKNDRRVSYGIVIYANADEDGTATIIDSIRDITADKEKLAHLVDECNRLELSPIHLRDVIEDFVG